VTPLDAKTRDTLEQLRAKYAEMLSMRLAHETGLESEARARKRMAELAARFPGALREIDELELAVIRERIRRLDAALHGQSTVEPWMEAVGLFHALARGALQAKRWLAGRKTVDAATILEYESDVGDMPEQGGGLVAPRAAADESARGDRLAWRSELARIAAPPRGRIMDLVFARVAKALGTTELEARALVFGPPRRPRE
jgi:hypothetical protein